MEYIIESGVNPQLPLRRPMKEEASAMHSCLLIVVYLIDKKVVEKWWRMYKLGRGRGECKEEKDRGMERFRKSDHLLKG